MTKIIYRTVESFITSLNLPVDVAEGILRTLEDCKAFYIEFFGRNKYVADDLLDFREHIIYSECVIFGDFLGLCMRNLKSAFEVTFLQKFSDDEILLIENALFTGTTTLEEIFSNFQRNININILRNIV